jgi:cation transport regulator ChaC
MCRGAGGRRSHKAGVRRALRKRELTLELIFHPEALAFDDDDVGMMQQPIQDRGGQGAVMVEDRGPLLEGAVGGNDQCPLFIVEADHLEEQIGTRLVNREIAELVKDEQGGFGVFFDLRFEPARTLRRGQRVDDINGTGKEHRVALKAGGIAQGRCQVGFSQADASQKDQVGFVLDKREAEVVGSSTLNRGMVRLQ